MRKEKSVSLSEAEIVSLLSSVSNIVLYDNENMILWKDIVKQLFSLNKLVNTSLIMEKKLLFFLNEEALLCQNEIPAVIRANFVF